MWENGRRVRVSVGNEHAIISQGAHVCIHHRLRPRYTGFTVTTLQDVSQPLGWTDYTRVTSLFDLLPPAIPKSSPRPPVTDLTTTDAQSDPGTSVDAAPATASKPPLPEQLSEDDLVRHITNSMAAQTSEAMAVEGDAAAAQSRARKARVE